MTPKQQLLESKVRKIVQEVMLSEGPNADAQMRVVKMMENSCAKFLKGKTAGLDFIKEINIGLKKFQSNSWNEIKSDFQSSTLFIINYIASYKQISNLLPTNHIIY